MNRSDISELHYICHIDNVASILQHGILSHKRAQRFRPVSVALESVQDRRERIVVPGGHRLHDYTNLYINARNPMMYYIRHQHLNLAVLRVSPDVLDLNGCVVTDRNAARQMEHRGFWSPKLGLAMIDKEIMNAEYWTHADPIIEWKQKGMRCAEVLIPDRVGVEFLMGVYASCRPAEESIRLTGCKFSVTISEHLFFYRGPR